MKHQEPALDLRKFTPVGVEIGHGGATLLQGKLGNQTAKVIVGGLKSPPPLPRLASPCGPERDMKEKELQALKTRLNQVLGGESKLDPSLRRAYERVIEQLNVGLVQGTVLTIAVAFLVVNVVVDLLYLLVNPRIRTV